MTRERLPDSGAQPVVEPPGAPAARSAAMPGARSARIAVIVSHGMGEQVPFETLNAVAEALWVQQSDAPLDASNARVRYVAFGEDWLPRVELTLRTTGERQCDLHLYEVYWASLTEGKVTARDAIAFLIGAALRGIRYCAHGSFDRWMFGRRVVFRLPRRGVAQLGVALAVFLLLLLAFIGVAAATVAEVGRLLHPGALPPAPRWLSGIPDAWLLGALALALTVVAALRWFLVQSVGDVAAYVSAHRASRFAEIRRGIQDAARRVTRNVYAARDHESGEPQYAHVIVVGHSLGSVIAYDMLNDSINGDLLVRESGGDTLNVVQRTKLLLTMGSPLDKTAFIFRTQKDDAPLREALAAAAQPMIVSYANRPRRWVNIWSPFDWVSGSLEYYDAPGSSDRAPGADTSNVDVSTATSSSNTSDVDVLASDSSAAASAADPPAGDHSTAARRPGEVENIRERDVPLDTVRAHLGYWKREEFGKRLFAAITDCETARIGRAPRGVSAEEALLPVSATARRTAPS
jgi:hypothetical protein